MTMKDFLKINQIKEKGTILKPGKHCFIFDYVYTGIKKCTFPSYFRFKIPSRTDSITEKEITATMNTEETLEKFYRRIPLTEGSCVIHSSAMF